MLCLNKQSDYLLQFGGQNSTTKSDAQISREPGQLWSRNTQISQGGQLWGPNAQVNQRGRLESSSTRSSFPTDHPKPGPLAVVSLGGGWGQWASRQSIRARHQSDDEAFGCLGRITVSAAVRPCLAETHHIDIQSTGHWAEITLCQGIAARCLNKHSGAQISRLTRQLWSRNTQISQ